MFKSSGRLLYDPKSRFEVPPWTAILKTDDGIVEYYQHWLKKHYLVSFETTIWGSHVSVIRGDPPKNEKAWNKYRYKRIEFQYSNDIQHVNGYYFLPVVCPKLSQIREELGLDPEPLHPFHLTIGRINILETEKLNANRNIITSTTSNQSKQIYVKSKQQLQSVDPHSKHRNQTCRSNH